MEVLGLFYFVFNDREKLFFALNYNDHLNIFKHPYSWQHFSQDIVAFPKLCKSKQKSQILTTVHTNILPLL